MNSITTESNVAECIRCSEEDATLVLNNFKEFPGVQSLTGKDRTYLFHKVHFFSVCSPCIVQLLNSNYIKINKLNLRIKNRQLVHKKDNWKYVKQLSNR